MYPIKRNRRLRSSETLRSLVQEEIITPSDFIVPLFIVDGKNIKEEIPSMPDYYRMSLDYIKKEVLELWNMGLKSVLLFIKVPEALKDNMGTEAINPKGLMQKAISSIKETVPEMVVMTDVALDPYSSYGHDGIVENNQIINDTTVEILAQMALTHAQAGADIVAPSDMMDGRVFGHSNSSRKRKISQYWNPQLQCQICFWILWAFPICFGFCSWFWR